jgi:hypothetical protein
MRKNIFHGGPIWKIANGIFDDFKLVLKIAL